MGGIIDKHFNLAASDLQFGTTNYKGDRKDLYNPAQSLVRFNFLEMLVRLSFVKYKDSGECETHSEAVKMTLD